MEIKESPPPCGEVSERQRVGWGAVVAPRSGPPPDPPSLRFDGSTSPQGGGDAIVQIARSWIGTPYVHQASVKGAGCDCLGLLRGVWRELHGEEPEQAPPYSPDWAEATGEETLYGALKRHLREVGAPQPGDIALFRMTRSAPAKHCGIIGCATASLHERTLIHARQNKRVSEEAFTPFWQSKLAAMFRM